MWGVCVCVWKNRRKRQKADPSLITLTNTCWFLTEVTRTLEILSPFLVTLKGLVIVHVRFAWLHKPAMIQWNFRILRDGSDGAYSWSSIRLFLLFILFFSSGNWGVLKCPHICHSCYSGSLLSWSHFLCSFAITPACALIILKGAVSCAEEWQASN